MTPARGPKAPLTRLRFDLQELSGAFGDIGVLIPIAGALIVSNGFNATSLLLVIGLTYIGSALYFRVPMPVQPLKAMAAVAIAQGLGADVVATGGLIMGALLLGLAFSGLIRPVASLFSRPVVRGIQLAVGLLLLQTGLRLALGAAIVRGGGDVSVNLLGAGVPAGAVIALALVPVLLLTLVRPRLPVVIAILPAALALGIVASPGAPLAGLTIGPALPDLNLPNVSMLGTALVMLVIPQLPLTLGNAVIASEETARGYFGEQARRVTHRSLLVSKGVANLFAGLIGGMPVCHGSGGLTAHYRFGARTGGATLALGVLLVVLALGFGSGSGVLLALVPLPVLGALLSLVGVQHALLARDVRSPAAVLVVATTGIVAFATGNVAIGFGAGIGLEQLARLPGGLRWLRARLASRPSRVADALAARLAR